ncbi:Branched-chain amino acid transport protein azlD [Lachnospiraceae bacterium TWA4]|nr:Branched-chain amino acid transport protein azlD [Lachnospiraceae bacterium TWA4]
MIDLRTIGIILMSAGITFFLRAVPFLIFRGKTKMPDWLTKLGQKLPAAIMAVLIVYCLKEAKDFPISQGIPLLISVGVVAGSYKFKHQTFLSIVLGTATYMVLLKVV